MDRKQVRHPWDVLKGTARGRQPDKPDGSFASAVEVQTYSGGRLHERPRRFRWEGAWLEVEAILREWRTPEESWFLVQTEDRRRFLLGYSWTAHTWQAAVKG